MKLSEIKKSFTQLGLNVAAITYDSTTTNAKFQKQFQLSYPLLSDENGQHAIAFNILNKKYEKGHRAYGVPHPGILLINKKGIIVAKFAEADYKDRPDFDDVVQRARELFK